MYVAYLDQQYLRGEFVLLKIPFSLAAVEGALVLPKTAVAHLQNTDLIGIHHSLDGVKSNITCSLIVTWKTGSIFSPVKNTF